MTEQAKMLTARLGSKTFAFHLNDVYLFSQSGVREEIIACTARRTFSVSVDGSEPIAFNDVLSRVGAGNVHVAGEKLRNLSDVFSGLPAQTSGIGMPDDMPRGKTK